LQAAVALDGALKIDPREQLCQTAHGECLCFCYFWRRNVIT